ncbi:MAG: hypothetical protein QOD74_455 [Variibacter sp.]|nr:hypothetical protein [Variibacter sp.]
MVEPARTPTRRAFAARSFGLPLGFPMIPGKPFPPLGHSLPSGLGVPVAAEFGHAAAFGRVIFEFFVDCNHVLDPFRTQRLALC